MVYYKYYSSKQKRINSFKVMLNVNMKFLYKKDILFNLSID